MANFIQLPITSGPGVTGITASKPFIKQAFDVDKMDWVSVGATTVGGVPQTSFIYNDVRAGGLYHTIESPGNVVNAAGGVTPGIASYDPIILINANESLGHNFTFQTNSTIPFGSNSFVSYNQALTSTGVEIIPSSWSIVEIIPLANVSVILGTGQYAPTSLNAALRMTSSGANPGLYVFQVNATSVEGLTTQQNFYFTFTP